MSLEDHGLPIIIEDMPNFNLKTKPEWDKFSKYNTRQPQQPQ